MIYSDINGLLFPAECVFVGELLLFLGNCQRLMSHAMAWLKKKRGVPCPKAGAVVAEYNFRFWHDDQESFPDWFRQGMGYNCAHLLTQ